jgi:hypothetical protein
MIASMFGSDEDLQHIEFDPGSGELTAAAADKLDTLGNALYERPSLNLEIAGFCDGEKDTAALLDAAYISLVKGYKIREITEEGETPPAPDTIVILPEERPELIEDLHEELVETGTLPSLDEDAFEADVLQAAVARAGVEEPEDEVIEAIRIEKLEARLRSTITIGESDLRLLARSRSEAVMKHLLASEKVDAGRLFVTDPTDLAPEEAAEELKRSRVDLDLR